MFTKEEAAELFRKEKYPEKLAEQTKKEEKKNEIFKRLSELRDVLGDYDVPQINEEIAILERSIREKAGDFLEVSGFMRLSARRAEFLVPLEYENKAGYSELDLAIYNKSMEAMGMLGSLEENHFDGYVNLVVDNPDARKVSRMVRFMMENLPELEEANVSYNFVMHIESSRKAGKAKEAGGKKGCALGSSSRGNASDKVCEYLKSHETIDPSKAVELTGYTKNGIGILFIRMKKAKLIERVSYGVYKLKQGDGTEGTSRKTRDAGMGVARNEKTGAQGKIRNYLTGHETINISDASKLTGQNGHYVNTTLWNMQKNGVIERVGRGVYSLRKGDGAGTEGEPDDKVMPAQEAEAVKRPAAGKKVGTRTLIKDYLNKHETISVGDAVELTGNKKTSVVVELAKMKKAGLIEHTDQTGEYRLRKTRDSAVEAVGYTADAADMDTAIAEAADEEDGATAGLMTKESPPAGDSPAADEKDWMDDFILDYAKTGAFMPIEITDLGYGESEVDEALERLQDAGQLELLDGKYKLAEKADDRKERGKLPAGQGEADELASRMLGKYDPDLLISIRKLASRKCGVKKNDIGLKEYRKNTVSRALADLCKTKELRKGDEGTYFAKNQNGPSMQKILSYINEEGGSLGYDRLKAYGAEERALDRMRTLGYIVSEKGAARITPNGLAIANARKPMK